MGPRRFGLSRDVSIRRVADSWRPARQQSADALPRGQETARFFAGGAIPPDFGLTDRRHRPVGRDMPDRGPRSIRLREFIRGGGIGPVGVAVAIDRGVARAWIHGLLDRVRRGRSDRVRETGPAQLIGDRGHRRPAGVDDGDGHLVLARRQEDAGAADGLPELSDQAEDDWPVLS